MSSSKNENIIGDNSDRLNKNVPSNLNFNENDKNKENNSVSENTLEILNKKRKRNDEKFPFNNDINESLKIPISLEKKQKSENNSCDISEKLDESDNSVESDVSLNNMNNINIINKKSLINKDNNNIININDNDIKNDENFKEITKIVNKSICIINCDDDKIRNGFFCNIPTSLDYQNQNNSREFFPSLIINNYSLKENDLLKGKISNITVKVNNLNYSIPIDKSRKLYSNSSTYNITIIEIKQADGIDNTLFLDIENSIYNENYENLSKNKQIYLVFNEIRDNIGYIQGKILSINNSNIIYTCFLDKNFSGGLLLSDNFKLIGIHKGYNGINNQYFGIFIKSIIDEIFNGENNVINNSQNIINEIKDKSQSKDDNISYFFNEKNIIFTYEIYTERIDSAFSFENGDILIFLQKYSILFDGKTFKPKLTLNFIGSKYCFCYLSEEEFISFKENYFDIYRFENFRSSVLLKQRLSCDKIIRINKLSNDDLAIFKFHEIGATIKIFRKQKIINENNISYIYAPYTTFNDYINDFFELISKEIVTITKKEFENELFLKLINTDNYYEKKSNIIKTVVKGKRKIYISSGLYKTNNNKFAALGINKLYIFDCYNLEVETIIKLGIEINKIIYLNDGYFLFTYEIKNGFESKYFIKKIKIDFTLNEIIEEKIEDIHDYPGNYKTLFKIEKYLNGGLITIINDSLLRIYK